MAHLNNIKGIPKAIGKRVLVSNMYFGEQVTKAGVIVSSDNGKTRGIYSRWGKVYDKGPKNTDAYNIGDWVLVQHGRWSKGFEIENKKDGLIELRMIDEECVLAYSNDKPDGLQLGEEYTNGQSASYQPQDFI